MGDVVGAGGSRIDRRLTPEGPGVRPPEATHTNEPKRLERRHDLWELDRLRGVLARVDEDIGALVHRRIVEADRRAQDGTT